MDVFYIIDHFGHIGGGINPVFMFITSKQHNS